MFMLSFVEGRILSTASDRGSCRGNQKVSPGSVDLQTCLVLIRENAGCQFGRDTGLRHSCLTVM